MTTSSVAQLGRLGFEVSDLDAWVHFATDVLGLAVVQAEADGEVHLRLDEHHHRITLRPGERDDIESAGWQVRDEQELTRVAERLESLGFAVCPGSADEARRRLVSGLVLTTDPSGVATDVHYGPLVQSGSPFVSPRGLSGFVAGDLGLGHFVLNVADCEESLRFYRDGLGLRITDYIDLDVGTGTPVTAVFMRCGPRHHSLAMAEIEAPRLLHHVMFEVPTLADVGRTYDLCEREGIPVTMTLGQHTNDEMISFYVRTPSGFQVEYGHGGLLVDDSRPVQRHAAASIWGHRGIATR